MKSSDAWNVFVETGDPLCWMLYRRLDMSTAQPSNQVDQTLRQEGVIPGADIVPPLC